MASSQSALSRVKVACEVPDLYHFTGAVEQLTAVRIIIRHRIKPILRFFILLYLMRGTRKRIVMTLSLVFNQAELFMKKSGEGIYWEVAGKGRREETPLNLWRSDVLANLDKGPGCPKMHVRSRVCFHGLLQGRRISAASQFA
jgi:hypothetical protein